MEPRKRKKKDMDVNSAELWSSTVLLKLIEKYAVCDIYDTDETSIYYPAVHSILFFTMSIFKLDSMAIDKATCSFIETLDNPTHT